MFPVAAVKDVKGAVIVSALHVVDVVAHLHLHRVPVLVLTTLEFLVLVFPLEAFQNPFLHGLALLGIQQNQGLVRSFLSLHKLFYRQL